MVRETASSLWHHRGFLHLWGAQATSTFGSRIGREAIALSAVMLLGSGPLDLAWLNVAVSLPYLIFGLAAGVLIDRVRRRPLLIATDLIRAALLATIPLAAWLGGFSLAQLLIVVFLVTACTLVFDAAHQTYVPILIEKRWLLDANAKQESTAAASEIVGPPIGGVLVQVLGAPVAILCDAVSYLVSALLLWRLPHNETPPAPSNGARVTWDDIKVGFLIIFRHRLFRPLALAKIIRAICGGAIGAFYVLYLIRDLQVSPAALGVIVGCGGAGGNTVNRLHRIGVKGAETISINTDKQALDAVEADKKLLIGKSITRGLGAGGYPEVAERCAEQARNKLEELLHGADLVFITAGMGGGTGTGSAPVVADVAKKLGAIVVGMVSTPFNVERARLIKGDEGMDKLRRKSDSVIVLDNNRLLKYVPNLPIDQAFSVMDELIAQTVKGISETITQPSLINLDYADVRAIMNAGGVAVMLWGEAKT